LVKNAAKSFGTTVDSSSGATGTNLRELTAVFLLAAWRLLRQRIGPIQPRSRSSGMFRFGHRARVGAALSSAVCLFGLQGFAVGTAAAEDAAAPPSLPAELAAAIRLGDAARLGALLDDAALANARDAAGNTPLILAALYGNLETLELLLRKGADPNAANKAGVTPLLRAATDAAKVERLLAAGAKVETRSEIGNTPLLLAARKHGNSRSVKLLLECGADPKARNGIQSSVIQAAAASGDLATVQLLLEKGADANEPHDSDNIFAGTRTPLMWAAYLNDLPMMRFLLERGADVHRGTPFGTPLSHAAWHDSVDAARLLLERGAKVDAKADFSSLTPLHWAAYSDQPGAQLVQLLLEKGADPNAPGGESVDAFLGVPQTPLELARKHGRTAIFTALEAGGARPPEPAAAVAAPRRAVPEPVDTGQVAAAAERALALLLTSATQSRETYLRHASKQDCLSCHQHHLPMAAVGHARERGLRFDEAAARDQIALEESNLSSAPEPALQATFHPEPTYSFGYQTFALASLKRPAGAATDLFVHHLATIQAGDGRWPMNLPRPPIQSSDVGSTALAILALRTYGWPARRAEFDASIERARRWLAAVAPETNEDASFQLLGLSWTGETADKLTSLARALLSKQRDDGGWAQLPTLASDAYATGQALYALAVAAKHPTTDRAWQYGLRFLLGAQYEDGSWHVARRAFPFQPTMPSGFPHGRDGWLSAAATSWAVLAMTQAIEPGTVAARAPPPPPAASVESAAKPVAAAVQRVDFVQQIQPLLERSCVACHGAERQRSHYRVDSAADMVKGGSSGEAAIVPGHGDQSPLVRYIAGQVDGMEMPPAKQRGRYPALTADEQQLVRAWIDQGAVWPDGVTLRPAAAEKQR
jgi:ankyrin repeat protein